MPHHHDLSLLGNELGNEGAQLLRVANDYNPYASTHLLVDSPRWNLFVLSFMAAAATTAADVFLHVHARFNVFGAVTFTALSSLACTHVVVQTFAPEIRAFRVAGNNPAPSRPINIASSSGHCGPAPLPPVSMVPVVTTAVTADATASSTVECMRLLGL
jgi:hypothetical protein